MKNGQLFYGESIVSVCVLFSVHLRVEEKISLTCGRDGGLQNMEVLGMVTLRVTDDKNGRIRLIINNNDNKGLQLQVPLLHIFKTFSADAVIPATDLSQQADMGTGYF